MSENVYTFFRSSAIRRGAKIYAGEVESRESAETNGQTHIYEFRIHWRDFSLVGVLQPDEKQLLTGKYKGFAQRSAQIEGYGSMTLAKRVGILTCGWKFVDYMSNEFKWKVSMWNTSWTLTDINGKEVAKFERESFKFWKIGTLHILEDVPDTLRALILLTCSMVHNTVKNCENHQASGG